MNQIQKSSKAQGVSMSVVEAVAEAKGTRPEELTSPLYDTIDPDALNALFRNGGTSGEVEFTYLGYRVLVDSDGKITLGK